MKCNIDASFIESKLFMMCVFRDHNNMIVTRKACILLASSILATKCRAMREAIVMASNLSMLKVTFKSDYLNFILAYRGKACFWEFNLWPHDIKAHMDQIPNARLKWVCREANEVLK